MTPSGGTGGQILLMTGKDLSLPRGPGPAHRLDYLIKYLDEKGIEYTAIFPVLKGPVRQWKTGAGVFIGLPAPLMAGVRPVGSSGNVHLNAIKLTRFFFKVLKMKEPHWRVCIVHGDFMAVLATALRQLKRIDFVIYEDLDYLPAFGSQQHSSSHIQVVMTESWAVRNSDLVVSVSDVLAKLRLQQGAKTAVTIPNGVDFASFANAGTSKTRKPYLLYAGTLQEWSGLHVAIKAMPSILKSVPAARFRIIGRGISEAELKSLARQVHVEASVDFLGPKDRAELPGLYGECSIGMATFPDIELMRYSSPLKVPEFLAAGLPVVSTGVDGTKHVLEKSGACLFVEANPEAVAEACIRLLTDKEKWVEMSNRAREAGRKMDWNLLFDEEMRHVRDLAGGWT